MAVDLWRTRRNAWIHSVSQVPVRSFSSDAHGDRSGARRSDVHRWRLAGEDCQGRTRSTPLVRPRMGARERTIVGVGVRDDALSLVGWAQGHCGPGVRPLRANQLSCLRGCRCGPSATVDKFTVKMRAASVANGRRDQHKARGSELDASGTHVRTPAMHTW